MGNENISACESQRADSKNLFLLLYRHLTRLHWSVCLATQCDWAMLLSSRNWFYLNLLETQRFCFLFPGCKLAVECGWATNTRNPSTSPRLLWLGSLCKSGTSYIEQCGLTLIEIHLHPPPFVVGLKVCANHIQQKPEFLDHGEADTDLNGLSVLVI